MLNLMKKTLESLLLLEEALLQGKTEQPKEGLKMTMESGKLQKIPQRSMLRKKGIYLRRQGKSSKDIKDIHQRDNQKSKNTVCLKHLTHLHHQQKGKG
jgi:hypothetical protein